MKIAIALHGISKANNKYQTRPKWHQGGDVLVDYLLGLDSYYKHLDLKNNDVYFHTYKSNILNEKQLIKDYSPKDYMIEAPIISYNEKSKVKRLESRTNSLLKSINLIDPDNYDFIISTRFDLRFEQNVMQLIQSDLKYISFGFYCERTAPEGSVDDNFMLIPSDKLNLFIKLIHKNRGANIHSGKRILNNEFNEPSEVLVSGHYHIWDNPLYDILKPRKNESHVFIKERHFNKIIQKENKIIKTGDIDGEQYWYKHIPKKLKSLFPKCKNLDNKLELERIHGVPLSYIYLNENLTKENLQIIFKTLDKFHKIKTDNDINIYKNYFNKFNKRCKNMDISLIQNISDFLNYYEEKNLGQLGAIHGDPVFTNILIDNNDNIKFIDMRGKLGDTYSIYGDIFYDYAKIYQSIIGYDFILNEVPKNNKYINSIKLKFENYIINKYDKNRMKYIKKITSSLLFSLIPLHSNKDKCKKYKQLAKEIWDES